MKLKKAVVIGCLGAVLALLLAGCAKEPLPRQMDEEKVIASGQVVYDLVMAEEYEAVAGMIREDIRTAPGKEIEARHIKELVDQFLVPDEIGEFKEMTEIYTMGASDPEPHGIAVFEAKYSKKTVALCVAFDLEMNMIGLSFNRQ
ncbi:MAG: DUF3887 domain-containing protein [Oscillospiraceae bacterium]|nr:DUF3887 domain-containing protein [Oscillospiraceae bacterium]